MKLKVYSWIGWHKDAPGHHKQTREIMAARSKAACIRAAGSPRGGLFNLGETGNAQEIATAMATPGVIHWRGLDEYHGKWRTRDPGTG